MAVWDYKPQPRQPGEPWSAEAIEHIKYLRKQGLPLRRIAAVLYTSTSAIRRVLDPDHARKVERRRYQRSKYY